MTDADLGAGAVGPRVGGDPAAGRDDRTDRAWELLRSPGFTGKLASAIEDGTVIVRFEGDDATAWAPDLSLMFAGGPLPVTIEDDEAGLEARVDMLRFLLEIEYGERRYSPDGWRRAMDCIEYIDASFGPDAPEREAPGTAGIREALAGRGAGPLGRGARDRPQIRR